MQRRERDLEDSSSKQTIAAAVAAVVRVVVAAGHDLKRNFGSEVDVGDEGSGIALLEQPILDLRARICFALPLHRQAH